MSGSRKGKAPIVDVPLSILEGTVVEVRSDNFERPGSWYTGTVLEDNGCSCIVQYHDLFMEDGSNLIETVSVNVVRPLPPLLPDQREFKNDDLVDVRRFSAWWEARISEVLEGGDVLIQIFKNGEDAIETVKIEDLRFTQIWHGGEWTVPSLVNDAEAEPSWAAILAGLPSSSGLSPTPGTPPSLGLSPIPELPPFSEPPPIPVMPPAGLPPIPVMPPFAGMPPTPERLNLPQGSKIEIDDEDADFKRSWVEGTLLEMRDKNQVYVEFPCRRLVNASQVRPTPPPTDQSFDGKLSVEAYNSGRWYKAVLEGRSNAGTFLVKICTTGEMIETRFVRPRVVFFDGMWIDSNSP